MDVKITKLPKSQVKIEVNKKYDEVKKYFDKAYEELAKNIEISGFRPGKAPRMLTIENIGINRYHNEALNLALPQVYSNAIRENKLIPVASPKINMLEFGEEKPFRFEAIVDLLPEVKLGDYKKIKIKYKEEKIKVSDSEIAEVVKRLKFQQAKFIVKDKPTEIGDKMEINFEGKVKGVVSEKHSSKNYPFILGEKILLPEFEKHLIGTKKGDKKHFKLDIKGPSGIEKVDFDVLVNDVWSVELPKEDDEFAKKFSHKTMKELKDAIGKSIMMEKENKQRQILEEKVLDEVIKKIEVEIPESLVEQEISRRIDNIKKQMGPAFSKYLENIKKTEAQMQKDLRIPSERAVKISLALGEISKDLGFFDAKKLTSDMQKNQQIQQEAVKKTLDKLIKIAK